MNNGYSYKNDTIMHKYFLFFYRMKKMHKLYIETEIHLSK